MLTFTLYCDDFSPGPSRQVHIDPAAVASVEEDERRPAYRGWHQVAVIMLVTGKTFVVEDEARLAAKRIAEAKASGRQ